MLLYHSSKPSYPVRACSAATVVNPTATALGVDANQAEAESGSAKDARPMQVDSVPKISEAVTAPEPGPEEKAEEAEVPPPSGFRRTSGFTSCSWSFCVCLSTDALETLGSESGF
eukprot:8809-Prorocentrum_minimum.AAC.3